MNFDKSIKPGPKSVVWSFDTNAISIVQKLYANIYPEFASQILSNQVYVSHTLKYSTIQWHGKTLLSNLNKSAKNCFVIAKPHFNFVSQNNIGFESEEIRLAEIDYFLTHSVSLPSNSQPIINILACAKWPLMHPEHEKYGNPVKLWYRSMYEHQQSNKYFLASSISSEVIFTTEDDHGETICISIPVLDK